MAYRALLFCPDEKAARTVTQVLGELEFSVESCMEPFAAVKRLMGEHFDAVVVDCDNEQNATLLFKSARNSTSNQASLAVAVVEGQAGVAKAFRIGANLVLTKPINIEQSKGTLRVARGLLRKGDPAKPAAPAATAPTPAAPTPAATTAAAAVPATPVPTRPVAPAKPAAHATPAAPAPRPAAPPIVKPVASPAAPLKTAVASSAPPAHDPDDVLPEITAAEPVVPTAPPAPRPVLGSQAASIDITSGFKSVTPAAPAATLGSGAASAPAPAREPQHSHVAEAPAPAASPADTLFEKPAAAVASESHSPQPVPTPFTFGGANVPAEASSGGTKKILIGVAAAVLVAAGLYGGWTYFHGRASQPAVSQTAAIPVPVATPETSKPIASAPKPAPTTPSTSASSPNTQPAAQPPANTASPASSSDTDDTEAVPEKITPPAVSGSTKPSSSASSTSKTAAAKTEAAPRMVSGGSIPAVHTRPTAPDAPAPSLIGIAAPGAGSPPPNLVNSTGSAPKPVLQTLNISQGVSQGLLIKKVQPIYPRNALAMHVEGAVELMATVSTTGNITAVKVVSGEQMLTRAAVDAVKQWKYKPYLLNGEPVEIQTQVTVNFKLPH